MVKMPFTYKAPLFSLTLTLRPTYKFENEIHQLIGPYKAETEEVRKLTPKPSFSELTQEKYGGPVLLFFYRGQNKWARDTGK